MKKILRRIMLCALMLFVLSLCIGCKSKTKKNEETTTDVPKDDGQIVIMSENKFNYRVVRGDNATDGEKKATGTLVTGLEDAAGTEIDVVTDWEGVPENEEIGEILVGRTNRPDSEKAYDGLSEKDYIIRVSGKSIVIAGGSDASLKTAVDYFMKQCVIQKGDRITVNADTDILITLDDSKGIAIACIDSSVTYLDELKNSLSVVCRNVTVERDVAGINAALDTEVNKIVIFAGADKVPAGVMKRLNSYLKSGGRILNLGGPAFETQLYESEGEWVTGDQFLVDYIKNVASDYVQTVIDASKRSDVDSLKHSSDVSSRLTTEIGTFGAPNSKYQLHVSMDNVNNWDLIIKSFKTTLSNVYGIGFYAKGSENTDKLYVEIRDSFNSRWYAVVGVDDEWGLKMLYASDFVFWDGPASSVKAGPAMNSLTSISIGFAKSGADYETGAHDFYLGNVSLYRYSDKMAHGSAPTLDCVSPEYEVYPVTNAESLQVSRNQIFLTGREYTLPQSAISCFPGRQGLGYDKGRANRFIPLLEYVSDKGLHSGYAAYMNLYSSTSGKNGDYEGCIVASFTPCGNDFYDKNGICAVVDVATAMMNDFFLIEGGSDELIYPVQDGGRMTVGATCVSSAQVSDVNAQMTVSLYKGTDLIKEWKSGKDCQMSQLKSGIFTMKGEYAIPGDCPDRVVTVLSYGGRVIDRIEQSIRLWTPKPESERHYITTSNGHFIRDGKILNLFGVNYMPSTSTAEADEKVYCTVTVCNTLQAAWRSGSVIVVSTEDSQISVDTVITDEVDYLGVTRVRFEVPGSGALKLRLSVGGYEFGSVFTAQI